MRKINKKGFTLIEIMIVIVIISLLAVTLVPKLTGAQARSRDASRTASLMSMKSVLVTYFDDYSEYPKNTHKNTSNWDFCLSEDNKWWIAAGWALEDYVEWGKTSFDPQKTSRVAWCGTPWSMWYIALLKNWSPSSAFILSAQTETYQKSNTIFNSVSGINKDWTTNITSIIGTKFKTNQNISALKTADSDSSKTIYTVTWD